MAKHDLRGSLQSQLNSQRSQSSSSGQTTLLEMPEAIEEADGTLVAYVGASASSSQVLFAGKYAYDPDEVIWVDATRVFDNPWQTRAEGYTDIAQLEDLIQSFHVKGQLQPFVCRPHPDQRLHPDDFEQAFGHRRKYTVLVGKANAGTKRADAVNLIGKVPILVRQMSDSDMVDAVIDENENRKDPRPMDQARGYINLQLVVTKEMADEGLIAVLPDGNFEKLASWREVAERKRRANQWRTLARGASLMQLPKELRAEFDAPGNIGFLLQAHGLALLTLQEHPQDQKRLLHDCIKAGWSGVEIEAQAKERLKKINERLGQGKLPGTDEASKTPAKTKSDESSASSNSSPPSGSSSSNSESSAAAPALVVIPGGASSVTISSSDVAVITPPGEGTPSDEAAPTQSPPAQETKSEQATLGAPVASETANEAFIRKARSFIDAASNELEQVRQEEGETLNMGEIDWALRSLNDASNSLRFAKNQQKGGGEN